MPEILRAILLPPPSSTASRSAARSSVAIDSYSPVDIDRAARRSVNAAPDSFLTLVESSRDDRIELKGKQFRFRPYTNRGTAERARDDAAIERASSDDIAEARRQEDRGIAAEVLDGFGSGARYRNSAAFLASFIAQERLSEGLYNPAYAEASDAYRRAGGSPPTGENQPSLVSFAA